MDRIHELLDEPLSTNTTASVEVGSSNDQNVHPYPVHINRREDYPKRDQFFFERLGTYTNFPSDCPGSCYFNFLNFFRFDLNLDTFSEFISYGILSLLT